MATVIVFGPTGSVGSFTALAAASHGAKVWLAMRDTSKSIPGLSAADEKAHGYQRIQADLTKPDTIEAAVKKSRATRAFTYVAHTTSDHMEGTLKALKAGGIESVVFLSSYTIQGEPDVVQPSEIIPYLHAQVEIRLEKIFGSQNYVAIRPGGFALNSQTWWLQGIKQGEVHMLGPDVRFDWTTPEDMGGVSGYILAKGAKDGEKVVFVAGPELIAMKDAFEIVQKNALDKQVKLTIVDKDAAIQGMTAQGMPPPIVNYIATIMDERQQGIRTESEEFGRIEEGQQNVVKYTGRAGFPFKDWVVKNKAGFQ